MRSLSDDGPCFGPTDLLVRRIFVDDLPTLASLLRLGCHCTRHLGTADLGLALRRLRLPRRCGGACAYSVSVLSLYLCDCWATRGVWQAERELEVAFRPC